MPKKTFLDWCKEHIEDPFDGNYYLTQFCRDVVVDESRPKNINIHAWRKHLHSMKADSWAYVSLEEALEEFRKAKAIKN